MTYSLHVGFSNGSDEQDAELGSTETSEVKTIT